LSTFLAGDTTYHQRSLIEERVDGVSPSEAVALRTIRTIALYADFRGPENNQPLYSCHG
jgi:hypothetical protein